VSALDAAYRTCQRLAREHYENFPVASRVLPRGMRPHVAALYAFARIADDLADEGTLTPDERLRQLEAWRRHLLDCAAGRPTNAGPAHDAVFLALGHTIAAHDLPVSLLEDLVSAFAQDVTVHRYETWEALFDYCRRSANPVGRLVLRMAGHRADSLDQGSDRLCSALQLTNFWQDFARDWQTGRLYLPREEFERFGAREDTLGAATLAPEWRAALAASVHRTRALFGASRSVCDGVTGRLRYELRLTWLGGVRILDRLSAGGFDPWRHRPTLGMRDAPALILDALTWAAVD
jgi:hydroxysqualene synthase